VPSRKGRVAECGQIASDGQQAGERQQSPERAPERIEKQSPISKQQQRPGSRAEIERTLAEAAQAAYLDENRRLGIKTSGSRSAPRPRTSISGQ
jgi:hypothetical protein